MLEMLAARRTPLARLWLGRRGARAQAAPQAPAAPPAPAPAPVEAAARPARLPARGLTFQAAIFKLQEFWAAAGCAVFLSHNSEARRFAAASRAVLTRLCGSALRRSALAR